MTRERILDTRPDGSVKVTGPAEAAIADLMHGGAWADFPWWFWIVQFQRMVQEGKEPAAAYRYARTMVTGGVTRREAIDIIAQRDVGHLGSAIEIVDFADLPSDREPHRNAWRRSSNGGPVWTDEEKAREIDEERAWSEYERA